MDFIDINKEEITESVNELSKTSLIIRNTDEYGNDSYKLSDSIRDLLLTNPKNIEVRNNITEDIKKRKSKILEQSTRIKQLGLSECDDEYIPENIDSSTYSLIADLNKCLGKTGNNYSNHTELIAIKDRFSEIIRYKNNDALLLFQFSRIFKALKDTPNELSYLLKADCYADNSPRIKLAIAIRYFQNNDYEDALKYFEYLIDNKFDNPSTSNKKFSYTVVKLYYLSLIYLGEFDKIIEKTKNWKDQEFWNGIIGASRATALKRKIEYKYNSSESVEQTLIEILNIFHHIFTTESYLENACFESNKIIKELIFIINPSFKYSSNIINIYLHFVSIHFFNIISKLKNETINSIENQEFIKKLYDCEMTDNPIHAVKWFISKKTEYVYDKEHMEELISDGFEIVQVYHIPEDKGYGMSSFMFAQNNSNQQFYLSVNNFDEGWNRWGYIKEGNSLAIKFIDSNIPGKPNPATEILEIDQY